MIELVWCEVHNNFKVQMMCKFQAPVGQRILQSCADATLAKVDIKL